MARLIQVISGGQTGADQVGWRAARRHGIATGGWMPKGFKTEGEDGRGWAFHPEYAKLYGAREHWHPDYPPRTTANVHDADGTVCFTLDPRSPGTALVGRVSAKLGKPLITVTPRGIWRQPVALVHFVRQHDVSILNVAGNRASSFPDVDHWVELYLGFAFRRLGFVERFPLSERMRERPVTFRRPMASTTVNRFHSDPAPTLHPARRRPR